MSIQFDKEIFSDGHFTLKVNFSGIKSDIVTADNLKLSVYAFNNINGNPVFSTTLNFSEIQHLYNYLNKISIIKDSSIKESGKFVEANEETGEILDKLHRVDADVLKIIFNKIGDADKINTLLAFLSTYEIDTLSAIKTQQKWQTEIDNLKALLELEEAGNIAEEIKKNESLVGYGAGQPEKIFQNWIELNYNWIFGIEYIKKHEARKIALYSEGDLLMESIDGFLDLIELKRPKAEIFALVDKSHKSYYPSVDLSKVIGQCLFYLQKMDDLKVNLEKEYKVKIIRPRIKIITGRTNNFNDEQFNALRMLNSQLNHIDIISYDSLIKFGEKMILNLCNKETDGGF